MTRLRCLFGHRFVFRREPGSDGWSVCSSRECLRCGAVADLT